MAQQHEWAWDNLRCPQSSGLCADEESTANQDVARETAEDAASGATPDGPDEAEEGPEGGAYTGPSAGCTAVGNTPGTTQLSFQSTISQLEVLGLIKSHHPVACRVPWQQQHYSCIGVDCSGGGAGAGRDLWVANAGDSRCVAS